MSSVVRLIPSQKTEFHYHCQLCQQINCWSLRQTFQAGLVSPQPFFENTVKCTGTENCPFLVDYLM